MWKSERNKRKNTNNNNNNKIHYKTYFFLPKPEKPCLVSFSFIHLTFITFFSTSSSKHTLIEIHIYKYIYLTLSVSSSYANLTSSLLYFIVLRIPSVLDFWYLCHLLKAWQRCFFFQRINLLLFSLFTPPSLYFSIFSWQFKTLLLCATLRA